VKADIATAVQKLLKKEREEGYEQGKTDWKRIGEGREKAVYEEMKKFCEFYVFADLLNNPELRERMERQLKEILTSN
jgi:hypothetical protein